MGAGGFEPPKLKSSRFTVCPHWPLGNTPRFCSRPLPDDLFILSDCGRFVNYFFRIFAAFLLKLSAGSVLGQMFPALIIPQGGNGFAGHGVEGNEIEYGHQADAHVAQIPHHGIGFQATHHQHDKGQHFIGCLPAPAVTKEVRHIGAGIEQDADEGGEAEQRQRDGNEHHAKAAQMVLRRCLQQIPCRSAQW